MDSREKSKGKPKVLIAGGKSFIGSQLAEILASQNCIVFSLDNFKSGKMEGLGAVSQNKDLVFIGADTSKPLPESVPKLTHIYDLVGIEQHLSGKNITLEHLVAASDGTRNLLERAVSDNARFVLTSTFDIYQGVISSLFLKNYWGFGEANGRQFSQHEAKRYAEALTVAFYERSNLESVIVRLSDIYGPGMNLDDGSKVANLIKQAVYSGKITIEGEGLHLIHPTYISDVISGLIKAGFSDEASGRILNLVSREGVTEVSFAYALKETLSKLNKKQVEVIFGKEEGDVKFPVSKVEIEKSQEIIGWQPKASLEEGLKETLSHFFEADKRESPVSETKEMADKIPDQRLIPKISLPSISLPHFRLPRLRITNQSTPPVPQGKNFQLRTNRFTNRPGFLLPLSLFFLSLVLFFFPFAQFILGSYLGSVKLLNLKNERAKSFTELAQEARASAFYFRQARHGFEFLSSPLSLVGQQKRVEKIPRQLKMAEETSLAASNLFEAFGQLSVLGQSVLSKEGEVNLESNLSLIKPAVQKAQRHLALAQLSMGSQSFNFPLSGEVLTPEKFRQSRNRIDELSLGLDLLPKILASNTEQDYLLLLQNSFEIRPTGGFIGSYGILKFKNGKLVQISVDDIYNLDGQQKFSIEPPAPLKSNLRIDNLYLRDANWNPNFAKSAALIKDIYERNTSKKISGVWAINVKTIEELVAVLGPIRLDDYNETITPQNFVDQAQLHSEIGFFAGSTSKKDFLGALTKQLLGKLREKEGQKNVSKVVLALLTSAIKKDTLFYFDDPKTQTLISRNDLSGELTKISTPESDGKIRILSDFVLTVDANVGANKANRFVKKSLAYEPTIGRDGNIASTLTLVYKNESPANTWPGGVYKNYLRIYLPLGSKISKVDNGGNTDVKQIETSQEDDKEVLGILVEVPVGTEKRVTLSYAPNYLLEQTKDSANYKLRIGKQSGASVDPIGLKVSYPAYLKPSGQTSEFTKKEQTLELSGSLDKDREISIDFSRMVP